jgi:putative FmdB family regulatory protein
MPTYVYRCPTCQVSFDVVKSVAQYDSQECCPQGHVAEKQIARFNFTGAGDWRPAYNPAFGAVVRSKAHQRELLAAAAGAGRPMVEVGNEPVENIHRQADTLRQEIQTKRWAEDTEKIRQEVLG